MSQAHSGPSQPHQGQPMRLAISPLTREGMDYGYPHLPVAHTIKKYEIGTVMDDHSTRY